jgi:hypothetical protein
MRAIVTTACLVLLTATCVSAASITLQSLAAGSMFNTQNGVPVSVPLVCDQCYWEPNSDKSFIVTGCSSATSITVKACDKNCISGCNDGTVVKKGTETVVNNLGAKFLWNDQYTAPGYVKWRVYEPTANGTCDGTPTLLGASPLAGSGVCYENAPNSQSKSMNVAAVCGLNDVMTLEWFTSSATCTGTKIVEPFAKLSCHWDIYWKDSSKKYGYDSDCIGTSDESTKVTWVKITVGGFTNSPSSSSAGAVGAVSLGVALLVALATMI